jgi:hypothetical protein
MPKIKLKNSSTPGAVPSSLAVGEIAINTADNQTYVGTSSGVRKIGGTLANQDSNNVAITGGTVTNTSISSGTLATNSLQLNSGTAVTSVSTSTDLGTSNTALVSQSAVNTYTDNATGGLKRIWSTTSNNTYTKSGTDVKRIKVICVGAGGGGRGYGESGGAGGMSELVLDATSITSVSITIGGGGGGGQYYGASGQGGTTSFGGYCSASGGYGSNQNYTHTGGHGGNGSGGNLNIHGGGGAGHKNCHSSSHHNPGHGGQSFFGGSNAGHHYSERWAQEQMAPGSGGAGSNFYGNGAFSAGYNGQFGICVVYEYR